jgi:hypothetical protein
LPLGADDSRVVLGRQVHTIHDLPHSDSVQAYSPIALNPGEVLEGGISTGGSTAYAAVTGQGASVVSVDATAAITRIPIVTLPATGGTGEHVAIRADGAGGYYFGYETS